MKNATFTSKRSFITTLLLCLGFCLYAQEKIVNVSVSGTLGTLLTDDEKANTTKLIVTTSNGAQLTEEDFDVMNAMPRLEELDMEGDENTQTVQGFQNNTTIKKVRFPKNMRNMGGGLFESSALEGTVELPASLNGWANVHNRMDNCQGITGFAFPDGNPTLEAIDGVIYGDDGEGGKVLAKYPCGKEGTVYEVPEGVTRIATNALGYNHQLEILYFPSTLTTVTRENEIVRGSTKIKEVHVAEGNPVFASTNGHMVNRATGTLMFFPVGNTEETLVIDGSLVKATPSNYFSYASHLKNVIFTEGFEDMGYCSFKPGNDITLLVEYIELPSTMLRIQGEAFHGCKNMMQIICKATTPPTVDGNASFREANGADVRVGVPVGSEEAYRNSVWNNQYIPEDGTNNSAQGFSPEQFVNYKEITVVDGEAAQSISVQGFSIKVTAGEAPEGKAFSSWTSDPEVSFVNPLASVTYFTMPDADVVITAIFSEEKPYTIIDGITPSGKAAVGSVVYIEAAPTKGAAHSEIFQYWEVVEGEGVIIADPNAVSTSFVMIDGEVTIAAIYKTVYMINISGGEAPLEAAEGEEVTIKASRRADMEFVNWTSDTPGVVFADAESETTTFIMPASEVNIVANFRNITGIEDNEVETIAIYPNPVTDYLQVSGVGNSNYYIYDLSGRTVMSEMTGEVSIAVSDLTPGIYIFNVEGKNIRFIKK